MNPRRAKAVPVLFCSFLVYQMWAWSFYPLKKCLNEYFVILFVLNQLYAYTYYHCRIPFSNLVSIMYISWSCDHFVVWSKIIFHHLSKWGVVLIPPLLPGAGSVYSPLIPICDTYYKSKGTFCQPHCVYPGTSVTELEWQVKACDLFPCL